MGVEGWSLTILIVHVLSVAVPVPVHEKRLIEYVYLYVYEHEYENVVTCRIFSVSPFTQNLHRVLEGNAPSLPFSIRISYTFSAPRCPYSYTKHD